MREALQRPPGNPRAEAKAAIAAASSLEATLAPDRRWGSKRILNKEAESGGAATSDGAALATEAAESDSRVEHEAALDRLNSCAVANEAGDHGDALHFARHAIHILLRATAMAGLESADTEVSETGAAFPGRQ